MGRIMSFTRARTFEWRIGDETVISYLLKLNRTDDIAECFGDSVDVYKSASQVKV